MSFIKLLSANMINKIAAGEVIERPASVVKELVENALDAGATRIELTIEKSGSDLIRLVDDGCGIAAEELRLAITSHATSKIAESDDLFKIMTLGFRGEALASIAEVSQMLVRSRTAATPEGAEISSNGGDLSEVMPCGCPVGTCIEVRNLFFNIPARRKFLKSPATEFGHITEAVVRLALPYPQVHFIVRHNGKVVYDLPPVPGMIQRIERLFGPDLSGRLIHVSNHRTDVTLSGYVGHPDASRPNNSLQYLFLNHRFIKDRSLGHALSEAYRGLLPVGRFPVSFLDITLPPDFVDVNVHPTKSEVRFANPSLVYSSLLGSIREEFLRSDMTSRPRFDGETSGGQGSGAQATDPQTALDVSVSDDVRNKVLDWAQGAGPGLAPGRATGGASGGATGGTSGGMSSAPSGNPEALASGTGEKKQGGNSINSVPAGSSGISHLLNPRQVPPFSPFPDSGGGLSLHRITPISDSGGKRLDFKANSQNSPNRSHPDNLTSDEGLCDEPIPVTSDVQTGWVSSGTVSTTPDGQPVLQIQQRYLVFETEDGMAVVDQHALHERILYEKIRAQMEQGAMACQALLIPQAVELVPAEVACALENKKLLAEFGLMVEAFGGNTIIITGYPVIAERLKPEEILNLLLVPIMDGQKPNRTDLLDAMMHQMACKAAVKAGDYLQQESIAELLIQAKKEIRSHHCPHGRPSTLVFSCQELDKLFKRT